jgi:hypothetical protein
MLESERGVKKVGSRWTIICAVVLSSLVFGGSVLAGSKKGDGAFVEEVATGAAGIGFVQATLSKQSQPLNSGTLLVAITSIGAPVPTPGPGNTTMCFSQGGCGFLTDVTRFTANGCTPPSGGKQAPIIFSVSGTFCQQPDSSWTYGGSFNTTSPNVSGVGSIAIAGGTNGQTSIVLIGALAQ